MKHFLLILFTAGFTIAQAQLLDKVKQKVKDKGKDLKEKAVNKVTDPKNGLLANARAELDSNSFSMAIAVNDNTGFYEENKKLEKFSINTGMSLLSGNASLTSQIDQATSDPIQIARNYNDLGEVQYAYNKFIQAEKNFSKAKANYEKASYTNTIHYGRTIGNLGLLYSSIGQFEKSEKYTDQAIELRKTLLGDKSFAYGLAINNKGYLYAQMRKFNEAEALLDQSIRILETNPSKDKMPLAIVYNNKAYVQQITGRYNDALQTYQKAIQLADDEVAQKNANLQRILCNKALLLQQTGKHQEALAIYQKALDIKEKRYSTNSPDYAHLLNLLAALYMEMGQTDKVQEYLNKALTIYKDKLGEGHPSYAETLYNLGKFYLIQNKIPEAENHLAKALDIRKNTLGESHPEFNESQEALALCYWQGNKIKEATDLYKKVLQTNNDFIYRYFPPMSEAEKEKYWAQLRPTYLRFYSFATQNQAQYPELLTEMYNAHIATKGILLSSTNKVKQKILSSGDQALIGTYNNWIEKKELLAKYYSYTKEELAQEEVSLQTLEKEANDLERSLSAKVDLTDKSVTLKEIDNALAPNEAALEVIAFQNFDKKFTGETYYIALVAGKFAHPKFAIISKEKDIETDAFKYYHNTIRNRKENKVAYNTYWKPIETLLAGKTKIYVSLDGVFNQVSLNTIKKPDGKYVIDDYNLVFITNSRYIPDVKNKKENNLSQKTAVLVGFPSYGSKGVIAALPGTKAEVEQIRPLLASYKYNTEVLLAEKASEENIKKLGKDSKPSILHIATHGFFLDDVGNETSNLVFGVEPNKAKENPLLRSGLMFSNAEAAFDGLKKEKSLEERENGILNAYEIMNLNLENNELTLLSACETGLGDVKAGEGVYGLQRAFQIAGADAIVMSLWKVSDEATKDLMVEFYRNLQTNKNKADAFRKAQLTLKQKYKEPYFWGAFMLVD